MGDIGRVFIRIVQRTVGDIGGIELRNMDLQPLKLRVTVDNVPCGLQIGESVLRL